jgi:type I restriction enzyme, S subunit
MSAMKTVALGDVCHVSAGGTPSRGSPEFFGGSIPWVKIGDMLQGTVTTTDESITRAGLQSSAAKLLPPGTVLISIFATIGRTAVLGVEAATNQAIAGVTPRDPNLLTPAYLRLYLDSVVSTLEQRARGAAQVNINSGILRALPVPVPPLLEQQRIADILGKADALRAQRRATITKLDTLTQSIFFDMFGDPATNSKRWPIVTIADLCEVKGGKRLPKGEEYSSTPTPFRYIRVTDLQAGAVDESSLVFLKPEIQDEISRYIVNTGDVIISIAGSIGLVAPVRASLDGANLTENAAKLVPREKGIYDEVFLSGLDLTLSKSWRFMRRAS